RARLLHRLQGRVERIEPEGGHAGAHQLADADRRVADRRSRGRERILYHRNEARVAEAAADVDAQLFDDVALHFSDRHLEHDLIAAGDRQAVDDLVWIADEARRQVVGALRFDRTRDGAAQYHAVAHAFDPHVGGRQYLFERRAHAVEIARDRDIE